MILIEILSKDEGYGNDNATKQEYDWLKMKKYNTCPRGMHFSSFLCRSVQNNVKSLKPGSHLYDKHKDEWYTQAQ